MRRPVLQGLLVLAALLTLSAVFFQPGRSAVQCCPTWLGASFRGYDTFYNTGVIAFRTGQTATMFFSVANDNTTVTVTAAKVKMDWGLNYSSTQVPSTMAPFQTRSFAITFTVPDTSVASNLISHDYTIIVERSVGPAWTFSSSFIFFGEDRFVVYSNDQADAQNLRQTYESLAGPIGTIGTLPFPLSDSQTRALIIQAQTEASIADRNYNVGNFTGAKGHWQNAVSLTNQALTSMQTHGSSLESAVDAYLLLGRIGPILTGIGFLIIGVGVVIYASKRTNPTPAPQASAPTKA